jgi:hypothetical protein
MEYPEWWSQDTNSKANGNREDLQDKYTFYRTKKCIFKFKKSQKSHISILDAF